MRCQGWKGPWKSCSPVASNLLKKSLLWRSPILGLILVPPRYHPGNARERGLGATAPVQAPGFTQAHSKAQDRERPCPRSGHELGTELGLRAGPVLLPSMLRRGFSQPSPGAARQALWLGLGPSVMSLRNEGARGPRVPRRTERKAPDGNRRPHPKPATLAVGRALQLISISLCQGEKVGSRVTCVCVRAHTYACSGSPSYPEAWHQLQAGHRQGLSEARAGKDKCVLGNCSRPTYICDN